MPKAKYRLSARAQLDLTEIYNYIARDRVVRAEEVLETFFENFRMLGEMPRMGSARNGIKGKRFWAVHSYLIVYKAKASTVLVFRVFSAYRDIEGIVH